ncbi:hypothetical protein FO519_000001, partial [Halicephalobus sp. NKZ332]
TDDSDSDSDSCPTDPVTNTVTNTTYIENKKVSTDTNRKDLVSSVAKSTPKDEYEPPLEIIHAFNKERIQPYGTQKELEKRALRLLHNDPITFACCVCTENYYKTDLYGKCSNIFRGKKEKNNKIHTICQKCLVMATLPEHVNLDQQGRGVRCPTGDCENLLLMSDVQDFMEERHKEQLLDRIGSLSFAAADIPFLIRCQNCSFPVIADNGKTYYRCPECKRSNCKNCDREYIDDHEGRTANKVDEIAVHRCHKCNLQFIKDGGCNKMTCSCGATQCYLCRAKGIDYTHFGEEKACQLFSDGTAIELNRIEEERRRQGLID